MKHRLRNSNPNNSSVESKPSKLNPTKGKKRLSKFILLKIYSFKVESDEKLVVKISLKLPNDVYTIVKHDHFTLCYSRGRLQIGSVRICPDTVFCKRKIVRGFASGPIVGGFQRSPTPHLVETCCAPYGSSICIVRFAHF